MRQQPGFAESACLGWHLDPVLYRLYGAVGVYTSHLRTRLTSGRGLRASMPASAQAARGISPRARVCPQLVGSGNHKFGKSVSGGWLHRGPLVPAYWQPQGLC